MVTDTESREYHRFTYPSWVVGRVRGVGVRVGKFVPSPYPYPRDGFVGFDGFFPRVFKGHISIYIPYKKLNYLEIKLNISTCRMMSAAKPNKDTFAVLEPPMSSLYATLVL
jgi:hypothetical protein